MKLRNLTTIGTYQRLNPITAELLHPSKRTAGLIAQEVERILPESVHVSDGYYSLNYQDVFVLGLRATQELAEKAEEQASQLQELREQNARLIASNNEISTRLAALEKHVFGQAHA